jgi:tRNA A37 threonylcarbamoyladenosine synthetase subunit TsaC/SUA5/YrdC
LLVSPSLHIAQHLSSETGPIAVTAENLREVFEKRWNPPAVMPTAFDEIRHKINQTLALIIPETTQDTSPEHFFA